MVRNTSLTPRMKDVLFLAAVEMLKAGKEKKRIHDEEIEGEIHTTFEEQSLVTTSGVRFTATVETNLGKGKVNYLVRPIDAALKKHGTHWKSFDSIEELLVDLVASSRRQTAKYN